VKALDNSKPFSLVDFPIIPIMSASNVVNDI
jgi:hypothetical protein